MKEVQPNDPKLRFLAEEDVTKARGFCNIMENQYWLIHPEKGLMFWQVNTKRPGLEGASPWCNKNPTLVHNLKNSGFPWAEVKLIPLAFVPIRLGDYA